MVILQNYQTLSMIEKRYRLAKDQVIPKLEDQILMNGNKNYVGNLRTEFLLVGVYESVIKKNISLGKQYFFYCALLDAYRIRTFNDRMFDYSLPQMLFVLLSDNLDFLKNVYGELRYSTNYLDDKTNEKRQLKMDEMVLLGESAIWCNTVQFFMANHFDSVKRNLNIIETVTLKKLPKNQEELKLDYEFYKALLEKDKSKCEEILDQLVSPKIHKKRNDNPVLNQYVSQPALGYAKLAWRLGVEVEVSSTLVPKELLPIVPLDHYEIPYDFLKS